MEEIDKISRRQERHLMMLYQRAEYLGMDVTDSNDWTIGEFEEKIFEEELIRNLEINKQTIRNLK